MLVLTVTNMVFRVFTACLIGIFTIGELFISFLVTLKVLKRKSESARKKHEDENCNKKLEETKSSLTVENEEDPFLQDVEGIQMQTSKTSKNRVNFDADGDSASRRDIREAERQENPEAAKDLEKGSEEKVRRERNEGYSLLQAAVCSIWIPCVVGDQEKRIFKTAGITSLVTKTTFLAIAIGLASYGLNLYHRPFLVWCLDESSPLINLNSSVTYCTFDDKNTRWPNCKPDTTNYKNLPDFEDTLEKLELAINNFEEQTKQIDKDLFQNEFPSYGVQKIQRLKKEVDMLLRSVGLKGITQKVRICGPNEFQKRIWTFAILGILFVLAALATYHLDKIASYKVRPNLFLFL